MGIKRRHAGRPKHLPTAALRRQVEMMAAFGNTNKQIAQMLAISAPTLRLHYRGELDLGYIRANNAVAMNLFRQATRDDPKSVRAAEFWLRTRAGWREAVPPPGAAEKLGKKEVAQDRADTVSRGRFAPPEAPKTLQ